MYNALQLEGDEHKIKSFYSRLAATLKLYQIVANHAWTSCHTNNLARLCGYVMRNAPQQRNTNPSSEFLLKSTTKT